MRSIIFLTTLLLTFPLTGCFRPEIPVETKALFCDVEEPRRFTQEELEWRAANAPWNLRRDFKTNAAWDRECASEGEGE